MKNSMLITICLLALAACSKKAAVTPDPAAAAREKFSGVWSVSEKASTAHAAQYSVTITAADNQSENVYISNFYNLLTSPVSAYVSGDSIYIPNQIVDGYTVFGAGVISSTAAYGQSSAITMNYELISATTVIASYGYNNNAPSIW